MTDKELLQVLLAAFDVDLISRYGYVTADNKGRTACAPLAGQTVRTITMITRSGDVIYICVGKKED